jgi:hypothetical protein
VYLDGKVQPRNRNCFSRSQSWLPFVISTATAVCVNSSAGILFYATARPHTSLFILLSVMMSHTEEITGFNFTIAAANYTLGEVVTHCHKPDCSWLYMPRLAGLHNPPPLLPNPELSGVGVSLIISLRFLWKSGQLSNCHKSGHFRLLYHSIPDAFSASDALLHRA